MKRIPTQILVAGSAAIVLAGAASPLALASPGAAARTHKPHPQLTARPDSAKRGTRILVTGTGFKSRAKVIIEECSAKAWVVPQDPCTSGNVVSVRASKGGRFHVRFTVKSCPARPKGAQARARVCFLGEPGPAGVDVVHLIGVTAITVTG